ncbi:hypothetical protein BX616_004470 [Lobosporangium transversale]|nr:hypothetical protein BX616_004470 [Lobosporangium transversale]
MKFTSILTLTAALCAVTAAAPSKNDSCTLMSQQASKRGASMSYGAVKGCFESHPYRPDVAERSLRSVERMLSNFYAFVEQAKQDPVKVPGGSIFKSKPVDILGELARIRRKKDWKSDYEFQNAIAYLLLSVNDGHLSYTNYCYRTAVFRQPISLYAPVVNGKQSVRVFHVNTEFSSKGLPKDPASLTECEVLTINGKPAMQYVQEFTDRTSGISKDPGVRLNDAFASTSWVGDRWAISPGGFAYRWELPEKSSVDYTLKCPKNQTLKLTVPWDIRASDMFEIDYSKNQKAYWRYQCDANGYYDNYNDGKNSNNRANSAKRLTSPRFINGGVSIKGGVSVTVAPATTTFQRRGALPAEEASNTYDAPRNGKSGSKGPSVITQAKLVDYTTTTAFYKMNGSKYSDVCVAVISTQMAEFSDDDISDYSEFVQGFHKLQNQGCKKLILDMTNNGGGSVDFSYFINHVFFPKTEPYFVQDLKTNDLVREAAKKAIKRSRNAPPSIFDARFYVSAATDKTYKDTSMFLKDVKHKRAGSTVTFSQKNYFEHKWPFMKKIKPVQFKPENMAIITNGFW